MKTAILQVADQGPLESLVIMLRAVGYECFLPSPLLRAELRAFGGLVLSPEDLTRSMGYDPPMPLPQTGKVNLDNCDLFVDIKAHQTYPRLVKRWPRLERRVLWYRINGGRPEHVVNVTANPPVDHGDEVNPPCPVLTPNQWYASPASTEPVERGGLLPWDTYQRSYACWPPFHRFADYAAPRWHEKGQRSSTPDQPVCLIHGINGWGYGKLVPVLRERLGVRFYGTGAPDGLLQHKEVPVRLSSALAMVHLKSSDAPGYAIYEALAAACPVVCTRRLIWRCRMAELLVPGETCLVFDRETHEGLTDADVEECLREIWLALERLKDLVENRRIGEAGRAQLKRIMWSADKAEDAESLKVFMERNFA